MTTEPMDSRSEIETHCQTAQEQPVGAEQHACCDFEVVEFKTVHGVHCEYHDGNVSGAVTERGTAERQFFKDDEYVPQYANIKNCECWYSPPEFNHSIEYDSLHGDITEFVPKEETASTTGDEENVTYCQL